MRFSWDFAWSFIEIFVNVPEISHVNSSKFSRELPVICIKLPCNFHQSFLKYPRYPTNFHEISLQLQQISLKSPRNFPTITLNLYWQQKLHSDCWYSFFPSIRIPNFLSNYFLSRRQHMTTYSSNYNTHIWNDKSTSATYFVGYGAANTDL